MSRRESWAALLLAQKKTRTHELRECHTCVSSCALLLIATGCAASASFSSNAAGPASGVHPLFDLGSPERSPFPSDRFTVADDEQNTARRVNLPMPEDCTVEASECEDVAILNQLDGFNLNARISVPFDGDIDPSSVTSHTVFLVSLGDALARHEEVLAGEDESFDPSDVRLAGTATVGINHIVWTPETRELSFRPDQMLDEHTTYVLVVTTGVRDANGNAIGVAEGFGSFRQDLAHDSDRYYRRALLTAKWAVGRVTGRDVEVAALSVFTTQTATHIVERMREAIYAAPAPTLNFNVGLVGERAVFADATISTLTQNAEHQRRRRAHGPGRQPRAVARDRPGRSRHRRVRHVPHARFHGGRVGPRRADPDAHRHARRDRRDRRRVQRLVTGRHAAPRRLARLHLRPRLVRHQEQRRPHRRDRRAARPRHDHNQRARPRLGPAHDDDGAAHRRHDDDVRRARPRPRPERRQRNRRLGAATRAAAEPAAQPSRPDGHSGGAAFRARARAAGRRRRRRRRHAGPRRRAHLHARPVVRRPGGDA